MHLEAKTGGAIIATNTVHSCTAQVFTFDCQFCAKFPI